MTSAPSEPDIRTLSDLVATASVWYLQHARDLPWRAPGTSPWAVLVSEVMLQQTPVSRVEPVFTSWMSRWPQPADLAASPSGEAVKEWGRLGYPRRALRLHAAATACVERHQGVVPDSVVELKALPGVGEYTAAAVASFAFGQRQAVLDTNVRRVHARYLDGQAFEATNSPSRAERDRALGLLPADASAAALGSIAVMELGAVVCSARSPKCNACPLMAGCAWLLAGRPEWTGAARRGQTYAGTDRQCRGRILQAVRESPTPVSQMRIDLLWSDDAQRERALASLLADDLIHEVTDEVHSARVVRAYQLPR